MKHIVAFLLIIIFLNGCASTRRFLLPGSEPGGRTSSEASDTTSSSLDEDIAGEIVKQFSSILEQAENTLQLGIEARQAGNYDEAQTYLDEVAQMLRDQDVEEVPDSTLIQRYDGILNALHQEYLVVLSEVTEISVESPAWAILNQMEESAAEADIPACGQWISTISEMSNLFDMEIVVNERVEKSLCFFLNQGRQAVRRWLERSGRYDAMMRDMLREEGLPTDLIYLSMIESGFNPRAYSYAHAVGLWQFIKGTGRLYDLKVDWWIDERRDPVKSTRAAAKYLKDLHRDLGDWKLAIAAYNCGKGRVEKAIREAGSTDFWKLDLPRQTENHVPAFLAAAIISKKPEAFGFSDIIYEKPYQYEMVTLDHCLDLKIAARCAGTTQEELKELNPDLNRWCTPIYNGKFNLKIPLGKKAQFLAAYREIPDQEKVSWHRHEIKQGESLSKIALKYGVSQSAIMDANHIRDRHRIRAGTYLLIPIPHGTIPVASKTLPPEERPSKPESRAPAPRDGAVHVVRKGDTLWSIASANGTTVDNLRQWNRLKTNTIKPGDRLVVGPKKEEPLLAKVLLPPTAEADEASGEKMLYTVKRNDSLWDIASRHGTTVSQLRSWNHLGTSSLIHPGDRLVVGFRNISGMKLQTRQIFYTVKKGDTLWDIARTYNVTINQIREWNNLDRTSKIRPGDTFKIYLPS
jgi:membrane-bound lytic murein transglycosylase D